MTIQVDRLHVETGVPIEFDKVLVIADGENITQGTPIIKGAKVVATNRGEGRGRKIFVGKFKAKNRYARRNGHRQWFTQLDINGILKPGETYVPRQPKVEAPPAEPAVTTEK